MLCQRFVLIVFLALAASTPTSAHRRDEPTVGSLAVRIAVEVDRTANKVHTRGQVKRLASSAQAFLAAARSASDQLALFNRFFFDQAGFKPEAAEGAEAALLLHHVLERRRGNCVGLAQAYLALTERLGLPVVAAATPTHLFVRWTIDTERFNVELLEGGKRYSDAEYRERYRIREPDPNKPLFLQDLNTRQLAARVRNNLGVVHSRNGRLDLAAREYDRAIELDRRFTAPLYNRGLDRLGDGRLREALADLEAALELYPSDAWALNNLGLVRLRLGERDLALESFRSAIAFDPDLDVAKANLRLLETMPPGGKGAISTGVASESRP